jgi:TolB protein
MTNLKHCIRIIFYVLMALPYTMGIVQGQLMSFQRDNDIWIKNLKTNTESMICKGFDPDISPDGEKIAFTINRNGGRQIGIIDINTKQLRVLDSIPGNNTYGPQWSPDGSRIVVNHYASRRWNICAINRNGSNFTFLSDSLNDNVFSPTWYTNEFIVCHDMRSLFVVDMRGKVSFIQALNSMSGHIGEASSCEIYLSTDSLFLLYAGTIDKPLSMDIRLTEEPQTVIYIYDIEKRRNVRISPNGIHAFRPRWVNEHDVMYDGFTKKDVHYTNGDVQSIKRHIYCYTLSSKTTKTIIGNGYMPSCSILK